MAKSAMPERRTVILIGLLLSVVIPMTGLGRLAMRIPGLPPLLGQESFYWTMTTIVLLYVLAIERRSLTSIGLHRPTWKTLAFGLVGAIGVFVLGGVVLAVVLPLLHLKQDPATLRRYLETPYWVRVAIVTRAAICEEILMRGYGIERLQELTGSKWIAGAVTVTLFALGHWTYGTVAQVLMAGAAGLALTILYIWRRDLGANMIAHWIVDGTSLLLTP